MARLYTNENFPRPAAEELRRLGHDVLTVQEAGDSGPAVSDEKVLDFATEQGRAVITLNRKHFLRLHQVQPTHSGIIVCTFDPDCQPPLAAGEPCRYATPPLRSETPKQRLALCPSAC